MQPEIIVVEDKICMICGCTYPQKYIVPIITDGGPVLVCPICADAFFEGEELPEVYAVNVYHPFKNWMNTEEGRRYLKRNAWREVFYLIPETGEVKMILKNVRVCYVNVFNASAPKNAKPNAAKLYSITPLVPKDNKDTVAMVTAARDAAIKDGIAKGKFQAAATKLPTFKMCLRDGDAEHAAGTRGEEFKGHYFFSCNRYEGQGPPDVVKMDGGEIVDVLDRKEIYSGMVAALDINFYAFNNQSVGIACGLNNVLKMADGDRLDGRQSGTSAFKDIVEDGEEMSDDTAKEFTS